MEKGIIVSNIQPTDKAILSVDKDRALCASIKMTVKCIENAMILVLQIGGQNNETISK